MTRSGRIMLIALWLLLCCSIGCQCSPKVDKCQGCPPERCVNGVCQKPDKCGSVPETCIVGDTICTTLGVRQECVNSSAPCSPNEYKAAPCPQGTRCAQGKCVKQSTCNGCIEGQTRCDADAGTVRRCDKGADGCLSWSTPEPCGPSQRCDEGSCSSCSGPMPASCTPGATECLGNVARRCIAASDGCINTWQETRCSPDQRCDLAQGACVTQTSETDLETLYKDVKVIGIPGVAGSLTVFGKGARVVVAGQVDDRLYEPVAAITRWNKGRIAALSHDGYLQEAIHSVADTGRFLQNVIDWLAAAKTTPAPVSIGIRQGLGIAKALQAAGYKEVYTSADIAALTTRVKVLVVQGKDLSSATLREAVANFIDAGGGLLIADTAWGWAQLNPGKSLLDDFPGNLFLQRFGIAWTGSTLRPSHPSGFDLGLPTSPVRELLHVQSALDLLVQHAEGQTSPTALALDEASHIAIQALRHLRDDDQIIRPQISTLIHKFPIKPPTPQQPLGSDKALERVLLTYQLLQSWRKTPEEVRADPAAATFPGAVPSDAPRVSRDVDIDTAIPDWHSTGLYAAPGEVITVAIPAQAAGQLSLRIGAHTDKLWHKDKWERVPEISRTWSLAQATTKAASAFGGLIYIVVPKGSKLGTIKVSIGNGVPAPRYVHGTTSLTEWRSTLRQHPAPWAELASQKLILTVPSSVIRKLEQPDALMQHWDKVLDACADLATIPHARQRPERIVTDQQISAGYMHAGYPIMTHLDVIQQLSDPTYMTTTGGWGIYHELGHNHQSSDWTFSGTGEVTVNLFTLYVFHTIHKNMQPRANIYGAQRQAMIDKYIKDGAKFDDWKASPFLALIMYMQLQEAFGWEAFKKVFAVYRALPAADRPKNDAERRDQWMVRFANAVGKDLGPFFTAWGIPVSAAAKASISQLPAWMPAGFPPTP